MGTTSDYNLERMLSGVLNACFDGGGCRHCGRKTRKWIEGHDGMCPTPALYLLSERANLLPDWAKIQTGDKDEQETA